MRSEVICHLSFFERTVKATRDMHDLIFIGLTAGFFAAVAAMVFALARL